MNQSQLDDLAKLLAASLSRGNILALASSALGRDAKQDAGDDIGNSSRLAVRMVSVLNREDRLGDAIATLRLEAVPNCDLAFGLTRILQGKNLNDTAALQQLRNKYQPFLNSAEFLQSFDRVSRTICAIGLGRPVNELVGSGFLVGPDLVMTNYHVLGRYLKIEGAGKILADAPGDQIFCYFDYLSTPAPDVPPANRRHASTVVEAADDWLVHARESLPYDGTARSPQEDTRQYDYVIIRLKKAIGNRPARKGGGPIRGWLDLPQAIDIHSTNIRVIVHQHPGAQPQHFDIGEYIQLDPSRTRVQYSVSTAHGSSGGAAVDAKGNLYALHNAEVESNGNQNLKLNQGVRIDKIAEDIAGASLSLVNAVATKRSASQFWSLSDDPRNPEPILGRMAFREAVMEVHQSGKPRVLVVTGPPGSGVRFSSRLLRRILGAHVPAVEFLPRDLQSLLPGEFLRALIEEIGIPGTPTMPKPNPNETIQKWLRIDLPQWLYKVFEEDKRPERQPYPIWVIINAAVAPGERLLWAENLKDFVATLAGAHDEGQVAIDLPQLRWLYLAANLETLPLSGIEYRSDDLATDEEYDEDFADCLESAWLAIIEKQAPEQDKRKIMSLARQIRKNSGTQPVRSFLALNLREMLLDELENQP
jgi:V8-like Glu-specific endopeptidase